MRNVAINSVRMTGIVTAVLLAGSLVVHADMPGQPAPLPTAASSALKEADGGKKHGRDECGCWSFDVWRPTYAEMRTKKVPVKTEFKRKVPGVEWKPEERCAQCRASGCDETIRAADGAP